MTGADIGEYLEAARERYSSGTKQEKGRILDKLVEVAGCHRKSAVRMLRRRKPASRAGRMQRLGPGTVSASREPASRARGGRPRAYDEEVVEVLRTAWEATDHLCSMRLRPFLPELVPVLQRCGHLHISAELAARVCRMSPSTIDRLLRPWRRSAARHRFSVTRSGAPLRTAIPVKTFAPWDEARPGFLEVRLVRHCGARDDGYYHTSLCAADVATGWSECMVVRSRGQGRICEAIDRLRERLPVPLLGLEGDFISRHLVVYCERNRMSFVHIHPSGEDNIRRVEQRNWSMARRLIGPERYSSEAALEAMDQFYGMLRLYVNFFQPTMKLAGKTWQRPGARKACDGQACGGEAGDGKACDGKACGGEAGDGKACDGKACGGEACDREGCDGETCDYKLHARRVYAPAQTPYRRLLASGVLSDDANARGCRELKAIYEGLDPMLLRQQLDDSVKCLWDLADGPGTQSWTTGKSRFSNTTR